MKLDTCSKAGIATVSLQGRLAITEEQPGNSSIVTMKPDGLDHQQVFDAFVDGGFNDTLLGKGLVDTF